jgi:Zn-dependent protease
MFSRFADPLYWKAILLALPGMLIGLVFHEFAHAWMANKMGDPTPREYGRLTLNPLRHLDLIGTLTLIFLRFGWAKPVPINPNNFRNPRRGTILVSIAGPGSNLIIAVIFGLGFRLLALLMPESTQIGDLFKGMLGMAVLYNFLLAFFNIIPVPPLDGSQILFSLLPARSGNVFFWLQRYGFIILIVLVVLGVLWPVIGIPSVLLTTLIAGPEALIGA